MFNASEMGQTFMRLTRLMDCKELFEQARTDGVAEEFAQHYILADFADVDDDEIECSAEDLGLVQVRNAAVATCWGEHSSWSEGRACVLIDVNGAVWIDSALHDEIFC